MFRRLANSAPDRIGLFLDGVQVAVPKGISVAAALLYLDASPARFTPVSAKPRTPYCMMGVCFDCLMEIDGEANQQACQVIVCEGMQVRRQNGSHDSEKL